MQVIETQFRNGDISFLETKIDGKEETKVQEEAPAKRGHRRKESVLTKNFQQKGRRNSKVKLSLLNYIREQITRRKS